MGNWGDAYTMVLKRLSLDSTTTGSAASTDAKLALIEAMNFHKKVPYWFNKKQFVIATENEVYRYDLPKNYMSLVSDPWYNSESSVEAMRVRLRQRPLAWAEEHKWRSAAHEISINTGPPSCYAIDEAASQILLIPVPNINGESVELFYQSDGDIPEKRLVSGTWKFYVPGTDTELTDTFQNGFLEHGEYMIVYRACWQLLSGDYEDGGDGRRRDSMERMWAMEQNRLTGENNRRAVAKGVRPHIH